MAPTIRIDDKVFHELQKRAKPLVDSPNDVLRRVFGLNETNGRTVHPAGDAGGTAEPVVIDDPVILIRRGDDDYRPDMSVEELYETTRYAWKVGRKRDRARLAFAVSDGVVLEAYEITRWSEALPGRYNPNDSWELGERWEFEGRIADESIRSKYVGRSVKGYFKPGAQNPIRYVNC